MLGEFDFFDFYLVAFGELVYVHDDLVSCGRGWGGGGGGV